MKDPNTNNAKVNDEAIDQHQPIVFGKFDFHDLDGTGEVIGIEARKFK